MLKNVKEFIFGMGLIVVAGIYFGGESKEDIKLKAFNNLKNGQIGYHTIHSADGPVETYKLVTPRGVELVSGERNLINSLEVYYKNGVLGKEL